MKFDIQRFLFLLILACLSRPASEISLSQSTTCTETPKKRVFKNEDLDKYQEKYGSEPSPTSKPGSVIASSTDKASSPEQASKGRPKPDLTIWRAKLKEIDGTIASRKKTEEKLTGSLEKYSKNLAEADTDFQKSTAQLQVAGVQENLTRTQAELKKAEEDKAKLVSDAKKAGIQEEDLLKSESSGEAKQ
jgi:hypothetical protein